MHFKNTIIILTSNLGAEFFQDANMSKGDVKAHVMQTVKAAFRPELINRLDEIVVFNSLHKENISKIVDIQLHELEKRLEDKHIKISIDDKLKEHLCAVGYDRNYGARPLKRVIQKELYDLIAREIIAGTIKENSTVRAVYKNDKAEIEVE